MAEPKEKDPLQYYPGLADACRRAYRLTIDAIRDAAREKGYAIGVHGSLSRDIDLIAAPWTDEAVPAEDLAEAVRVAAARAIPGGNCWSKQGDPKAKPHGRLCWSFYFAAGGYLDLSVMPRHSDPRILEGGLEGCDEAQRAGDPGPGV